MFNTCRCFSPLDLVHLDGLEDEQYACSVPSWSACRLITSKVAFSYYLVFPARAFSFLFVPVFSCVS